jgi:hypothetical protein
MEKSDHEKDKFFKINNKLHKYLLLEHLKFDEKRFLEVYEILHDPLWK